MGVNSHGENSLRGGQGRPRSDPSLAARLLCRYNFVMSVHVDKKSRRGRPRVDSDIVTARVARPVLDAMDAWIAAQPEPRPSRPEAIRLALKDWLTGLGYLLAAGEAVGMD